MCTHVFCADRLSNLKQSVKKGNWWENALTSDTTISTNTSEDGTTPSTDRPKIEPEFPEIARVRMQQCVHDDSDKLMSVHLTVINIFFDD